METLEKIKRFTDVIYKMGDGDGVTKKHIKMHIKGKSDKAAALLFDVICLFEQATVALKEASTKNEKLKEELAAVKQKSQTKDAATATEEWDQGIKEYTNKLDKVTAQLSAYADTVKCSAEAIEKNNDNIVRRVEEVLTRSFRANSDEVARRCKLVVTGLSTDAGYLLQDSRDLVNDIYRLSGQPGSTGSSQLLKAYYLGSEYDSRRPICWTFTDPSVCRQILDNALLLNGRPGYRGVRIAPFKDIGERRNHSELVKKLTKKIKDDPTQFWYIKDGQVLK